MSVQDRSYKTQFILVHIIFYEKKRFDLLVPDDFRIMS